MRKLKLQVQMTLDGYVAGPNGELDWMTCPWTEDLNGYVQGITDPVDTIVLGRKLAEGFIPYWASVAADPENPEFTSGKMFTETPKVVFTHTLDQAEGENTVLAKGDLAEEINKLKNQDGRDIIAYGGATFVSSLLQRGLVDELHLFFNPTAIGTGMAIFNDSGPKQNFTLIKATSFACGIVALHYKPKRNQGPKEGREAE